MRFFKRKSAFTIVEVLIVAVLLALVLYFAYRLFFSQTKVVTQTIDTLQTNEGFRRVLAFMGDDIREATRIVKPTPINLDEVSGLETTIGTILTLQSSEIDPRISFDSPLGGQISQRTQIDYELEPMKKNEDEEASDDNKIIRFRLIRNAMLEEKNGEKTRQRQVIADNIKELIIYRTVRKPFKPGNVESMEDRIIQSVPLSEAGTGNSLIHVKMVIERHRNDNEKGDVYNISMNTSFYKRGKEIFLHP